MAETETRTTETESSNGSDKESKEEFRDRQKQEAEAQNLTGENAVPEQRGKGSQERHLDHHESETYKRLRDAGELESQQEPMDQEAYDRASSDSQAKKAEKDSRSPNWVVGTRLKVVDEDSVHQGRNVYVDRIQYEDQDAEVLASLGTPNSSYAEVHSYVVKTRDGRPETLEFEPEQLREVAEADWGRGEI